MEDYLFLSKEYANNDNTSYSPKPRAIDCLDAEQDQLANHCYSWFPRTVKIPFSKIGLLSSSVWTFLYVLQMFDVEKSETTYSHEVLLKKVKEKKIKLIIGKTCSDNSW